MPIHHRVVVLIDAENVSGDFASDVLRKAGAYGATVTRRAYGDFAQGRGAGWLSAAAPHAIDTIQVSSPCGSKNFSDMRMTIDAVELMVANKADVFCLVSSDGDFTPLAIHLRGAGKVAGRHRREAGIRNVSPKLRLLSYRRSTRRCSGVLATTPKPQAKPQEQLASKTAGIVTAFKQSLQNTCCWRGRRMGLTLQSRSSVTEG